MANIMAEAIAHAGDKAKYNDYCKEILSCRQILFRILQETTEEFRSVPLSTIEKCIEGTPEISSIPLHGYNSESERIVGCDTVDIKPGEGEITYDIKFVTYTPMTQGSVKIYMNIEAQKKFNPGYSLVTRGIYYGARMISSQYGVEFKSSKYDNIKKVYSIWICTETPENVNDSIIQYAISKKDLIGYMPDNKIEYDKMTLIFIYLNDYATDGGCKLTRMLNIIFSEKLCSNDKLKRLEQEFGLIFEDNEKEAMNQMCNLAEGLEERITERVTKQVTEQVTEQVTKQVTKQVTEQVTEQVTSTVTNEDIKKAANMFRKAGLDKEKSLKLISEEYGMSENVIMEILSA